MTKSCQTCIHRTTLNVGGKEGEFCTGAPPTAVVTVNTDAGTVTVSSSWPPIPGHPCGAHKSTESWWRWVWW